MARKRECQNCGYPEVEGLFCPVCYGVNSWGLGELGLTLLVSLVSVALITLVFLRAASLPVSQQDGVASAPTNSPLMAEPERRGGGIPATDTPAPTDTVVPVATMDATATIQSQQTADAIATSVAEQTATASAVARLTVAAQQTATAAAQAIVPTDTSTPRSTNTPTPRPTNTSTPRPTNTPTPRPTNTSTPRPTNTPTVDAAVRSLNRLLENMRSAAPAAAYPQISERFADVLISRLGEFRLPHLGVTTQTMSAALDRVDSGMRLNALINEVWAEWSNRASRNRFDPYSVDPTVGDPQLSPFRQLVIRLLQGRQGALVDSQQHALHSYFTRTENTSVWFNDMDSVIGAINRESFLWP